MHIFIGGSYGNLYLEGGEGDTIDLCTFLWVGLMKNCTQRERKSTARDHYLALSGGENNNINFVGHKNDWIEMPFECLEPIEFANFCIFFGAYACAGISA